jgi:hypothetical protein
MISLKKLTVLTGILAITSCTLTTRNVEGGAYIVESTATQIPIQGAYLEIQYTTDEGGTYDILATTTTDENGTFNFYSANIDNIFSPNIIHADTFSLEHTIYAVPRMDSLPVGDYSDLTYSLNSFPVASGTASNYSVSGPIQIGDKFDPIELIMSFQTQHWIQYGYGQIAQTSILNSQNQEINGGFFLKTPGHYTAQGDTVYLEYRPRD